MGTQAARGLAGLIAWAEGRLPRLVDDASAAVLNRIPLYRGGGLVPLEELHRSIAQNLRSVVIAIGHPQASLDLASPQETGRRRAHQGVPLPEVLQAYRISFATLWDELVADSRRGRQPVTALLLIRVAENTAGRPWNRIRAELQRQHAVTWTGPAGTFRQATDPAKPLRDLYTALDIEPPKKILALAPAPTAS